MVKLTNTLISTVTEVNTRISSPFLFCPITVWGNSLSPFYLFYFIYLLFSLVKTLRPWSAPSVMGQLVSTYYSTPALIGYKRRLVKRGWIQKSYTNTVYCLIKLEATFWLPTGFINCLNFSIKRQVLNILLKMLCNLNKASLSCKTLLKNACVGVQEPYKCSGC